MIVTSINTKGSYVVVAFDDERELKLPIDTFIKSGMRKNDEVSEKQIKQLERNVELYKIKDSAYRFLSRRDHSVKELKLKLIKKKFNKELINEVIEHLKSLNFLDDEKFAKSFCNELLESKMYGSSRIQDELYKKGVNREIVESVVPDEYDNEKYFENAKILASKKLSQIEQKENDSIKIKQKLYNYLTNKGYSGELINKIFQEFGVGR